MNFSHFAQSMVNISCSIIGRIDTGEAVTNVSSVRLLDEEVDAGD